jgi:hypothetical protein
MADRGSPVPRDLFANHADLGLTVGEAALNDLRNLGAPRHRDGILMGEKDYEESNHRLVASVGRWVVNWVQQSEG